MNELMQNPLAMKSGDEIRPRRSAAIEPSSPRTCTLWLVYLAGIPFAAYPRKMQAEVYASGFARHDNTEVREGTFTENTKVRV